MAAHLLAAGVIGIAGDADLAALGLALAGQHLDELTLAVAGDAGDADDLAGADRERDVVHGDGAGVIERAELLPIPAGPGRLRRCAAAARSAPRRRSWFAPSHPA